MPVARMRFRSDGYATIKNIGGVILITAPTWRSKRWATKQLKMKAAAFGITLKRRNGAWYADPQKMREAESRLFELLNECCVSSTVRELRRGEILDKGF